MKQYDLLKKNLRGYKVEVDKEKLWQQTLHAIPQKKKRRPIVLPFLFGALLLTGGLVYYHVDGLSQLYANYRRAHIQESLENTALVSNQKDHSISINQEETTSINFKENTVQSNGNSPYESPNSLQVSPSSPVDQEQKDKSINSEFNEPLLLSFNSSAISNKKSFDADTKSELLTSQENIHWNTASLEALPISPLSSNSDPEIKGINHSGITPGSPYKNVFSIAILQGLGFSSLSFNAGNPQAEDMGDFLSNATQSLESVSTTVRGNVQLTKGFAVSAGLAYRRLTTETIYQNTITERMEQEGTTTIIIDELGQQHLVSGNIGTTHLTETEHTRYSTHQKVDVELTLHKRLFGIHRTTVNGFLKAGVNVHYSAEGSAFTSEYALVRFQDSDNPYSLSSLLAFGGGIDVQHRLSPRWLLLGAAGIDQFKIHHKDYNQLQWRHTIYSLSLGVGYVL